MNKVARSKSGLELKGLYSIIELSEALNISEQRLSRLLTNGGVIFERNGAPGSKRQSRSVAVSELAKKFPRLWESLIMVMNLKAGE